MGLIEADMVLRCLNAYKTQLKADKFYRSSCTVERCIEKIMEIPNAEPVVKTVVISDSGKTAERKCLIEKWFPDRDCVTGREVWYCGSCGTRIEKKDRYCRGCGRRFVE